jgi:ABC-2 type transport system ATP-binding protein
VFQKPLSSITASSTVIDNSDIPDHWTGRDLLTSVILWYGLDPVLAAQRAEELLGPWDLAEAEITPVREYSPDMIRKISLLVTLLPEPQPQAFDTLLLSDAGHSSRYWMSA